MIQSRHFKSNLPAHDRNSHGIFLGYHKFYFQKRIIHDCRYFRAGLQVTPHAHVSKTHLSVKRSPNLSTDNLHLQKFDIRQIHIILRFQLLKFFHAYRLPLQQHPQTLQLRFLQFLLKLQPLQLSLQIGIVHLHQQITLLYTSSLLKRNLNNFPSSFRNQLHLLVSHQRSRHRNTG